MSGPVETAAALTVAACVVITAMFAIPKMKPEPPTEKQIPAEELAKLEDSGTQPEGENVPVVQRTNEVKLDAIEQRLQEIQAKVSRIEKKADEPRRD